MYVGLFLAPLGLVRLWAMATRRERWGKARWRTFLAFVVAAQTLCCGVAKHHLPLLRNMLTDLGVGPRTLVEPYHLHPFWAPVSIGGGWWVITEIALLTAGILFCDGIALCRRSWREIQTPEKEFASRQGLFLLLWAAMMTAALLGPWISALYDRYLVQALVPWCLVFAYTTAKRPSPGRAAWGLGIAGLLIVAAFGVACLQDYLAWNRARWDAVQLLHERFHATPAQVDGGYEYNGLYTSDGYQDRMRDKGGMEDSRAGWYLIDNQYTISFLPREGYREIARAPYFSWLGMERRELLVEERTDPDTAHN